MALLFLDIEGEGNLGINTGTGSSNRNRNKRSKRRSGSNKRIDNTGNNIDASCIQVNAESLKYTKIPSLEG